MKSSRQRTLRGQLLPSGGFAKTQIIVDDGRINVGYKVTDFIVWAISGQETFNAALSFAPVAAASKMDAADNSQFAWSWKANLSSPQEAFIDMDHIAVRDMHVTIMNTNADLLFNYVVVLEEYNLTNDEAIMNIIKEGAQSL